MYNKEQLMGMKVDELRKVASSVGIKNAKRYKKVELVDMIISTQNRPETVVEAEAVKEEKEEMASTSGDTDGCAVDSNKLRYINEAPIGTLVAFKLPNGQTKSAKIINRSTGRKKLKLERFTESSLLFRIPILSGSRAQTSGPVVFTIS